MRKKRAVLKMMLPAIGAVLLLVAGSPLMANEKPISEGLVFDEGRFVDPPYTVSVARHDSSYEVAINGLVIDRIEDCPPPESFVYTDPGPYSVPDGVDALRTSGFPLYCSKLFNFLEQEYGVEEARQRIISLLEASPLVTSMEIVQDGASISDKYNDHYFIAFLNPEVRVNYDSEKLARETASVHRRHLSDGGAILIFESCQVFFPKARVRDVLLPSLRILEDANLSPIGKKDAVSRLWEDHPAVGELLENYKPNPLLWERRK